MGFMDMFKNKNREIKKTNDFLKDQLIEQISNLSTECRDVAVKDKLNSLRKELESQSQLKIPRLFPLYKKLRKKLQKRKGMLWIKILGLRST